MVLYIPHQLSRRSSQCLVLFLALLSLASFQVLAQSLPTDPRKANVLLQWGRNVGKMGQSDFQLANTQATGFGFGKSSTSHYPIGPTPVGLLDDFSSIPTDAEDYWHASTTYWTIVAAKTRSKNQIRWFFSGALYNRYEDFQSVFLPSPLEITATVPEILANGNTNLAVVRASACTVIAGVLSADNATLSVYTWRIADSAFYCQATTLLGRATEVKNSSSPTSLVVSSMALPTPGSFFLDCGKQFCIVSNNRDTIKFWGQFVENDAPPSPENVAATPTDIAGLEPSDTFNFVTISDESLFVRLTNGSWLAWGDNSDEWITSVVSPDLVAQPFSMPSNVIDLACGSEYCHMLVETTNTTSGASMVLLQSFGNNDCGQLGGDDWFGSLIQGSHLAINATKAMRVLGGASNIKKISTVVRTSFALLHDNSLWVWGCNGDFFNRDGTSSATAGIIDSPSTGLLGPDKVPIPSDCTVLDPPRSHGVSWETRRGAIAVGCFSPNVNNLRASYLKPTYSPMPSSSENYRNGIIAWGATAQPSLDWYSRPLDQYLPPTATDSFYGLPMANKSVHSAQLFAPHPYIMNLPMDYEWKKVMASKTTVIVAGFSVGSSPSFDPSSPVNIEVTVPDVPPSATSASTPDLFVWGGLKASHNNLTFGNTDLARTVPLFPFSGSDQLLGIDIYSAAVKMSPGFLDFATAENFWVTIAFTGGTYHVNVGGLQFPTESSSVRGYPLVLNGPAPVSPFPYIKCGSHHCIIALSSTDLLSVAAANMTGLSAAKDFRLCRVDPGRTSQLPFPITIPATGVDSISVGHDFTVIASGGVQVYVCGISGSNALQGNLITSPLNMTLIGTVPSSIVSMASGYAHTLILTSTHGVYSLGDNSMGQLGKASWSLGPVSGLPSASTISSVACVRHTSFAVLTDGNIYAWGENSFTHLFGSFSASSGIYSSSVPVLATLSNAMRIDTQIQSIMSHPTARTVFAIAKLRALSTPPRATAAPPLLKFGIDPHQRYLLSPTHPTWYDSKAEIPTFLKSSAEHLTMASVHHPISWFASNLSNIYFSMVNVSGSGDLPEWSLFNTSVSSSATKFAPAPVYFSSIAPLTISKMVAVRNYGILIRVGNSRCIFLPSKASFSSPFEASALSSCADFDCSSTGCVILSSSRSTVTMYLHVGETATPYSTSTINLPTPGVASLTMLSKCFILAGSATSWCAAAALSNSSYVFISPNSYIVNITSGLPGPIKDLVSAENYALATDGSEVEMLWLTSKPFGSVYSRSFVCPTSHISSISATHSSWFVVCASGTVYGVGKLPPQLSVLDSFSSTNSFDLSFNPWINFLDHGMPTQMGTFFDLATNESKLVSQIAGDRSAPPYAARSFAFYAIMKYPSAPAVPSSPSASRSCSPSSPPSNDPLWYCDSAGIWTYPGSLTLSAPLVVSGSGVYISGNLTAPSLSIIIDSNSNSPYLLIEGCANLSNPIQVQMTGSNLKGLSGRTGQRVLVLDSSSSCGGQNPRLTAFKNNQGCKKWNLKSESVQTGSRTQLYAVISVTSNSCSLWWIILLSVLGGLIILVALALIVIFASPLKMKVMPYKNS